MSTSIGIVPSNVPLSSGEANGKPLGRSPSQGKLTDTAREFEAILLGQWLQAAESSFATVPGAEEDDSEGDQMKSFGTQQLAKALSDTGGVGIAKMVTHALNHSAPSAATSHASLIRSVSR